MPLRTETTVEYYFDKAYLFYCSTHDCLRVSNNHEDSLLLQGITQKDVNEFIASYFEYVLEDTELQGYFKERLEMSKYVKKVEQELLDDE